MAAPSPLLPFFFAADEVFVLNDFETQTYLSPAKLSILASAASTETAARSGAALGPFS
jgi:hypothetical protein